MFGRSRNQPPDTDEGGKEQRKDSPKETSSRSDQSSRDALLAAARVVFAERGYDGATVKDLAEKAGVNVSLVSYYFGGKEGLFRTVIEEFGHDRLSAVERVLKKPSSAEEFRLRLRMFAEEFLRANLRDLDICKILHRDFDMGMNPIAMEAFKTSMLPVFLAFVDFIKGAQQSGIVRADLDPETTVLLMFGSLSHCIRADSVRQSLRGETLKDEAVLEKTVHNFTCIMSDGVMRRQQP